MPRKHVEGYGTTDYSGSKLWLQNPAEDSLGGERGRGVALLGGGETWMPALIRGEEGGYNATVQLERCMSHLEEIVIDSSAPPGGGAAAALQPLNGGAHVAVHGDAVCQDERARRESVEAALELLRSEAGR